MKKISNLNVLPARTSMSYMPGCLKVAFANLVFAVIVADGSDGGEKFHSPCLKRSNKRILDDVIEIKRPILQDKESSLPCFPS